MKNYFWLLFTLFPVAVSAQAFEIIPNPMKDSVVFRLNVDYGDSLFLDMRDLGGRLSKHLLLKERVTHSFVIKDTLTLANAGMYILRRDKNLVAKFVKESTSMLYYEIQVKIKPESIPAETFVLYPNPCKSDNLHLLLGKEWAEGELTIVSPLGYVIARIPAAEVMNAPENLWSLPILPSGTYFVHLDLGSKEVRKVLRVE